MRPWEGTRSLATKAPREMAVEGALRPDSAAELASQLVEVRGTDIVAAKRRQVAVLCGQGMSQIDAIMSSLT